jgi:TonB family protein
VEVRVEDPKPAPEPMRAAEPAAAPEPPAASAGNSAPATASAMPAPPTFKPARVLARVQPEYTTVLRAAKLSGTVEVKFSIDADGRVTSARALNGAPAFREAAVAAIYKWTFAPATRGDVPVASDMTVQFAFGPRR